MNSLIILLKIGADFGWFDNIFNFGWFDNIFGGKNIETTNIIDDQEYILFAESKNFITYDENFNETHTLFVNFECEFKISNSILNVKCFILHYPIFNVKSSNIYDKNISEMFIAKIK